MRDRAAGELAVDVSQVLLELVEYIDINAGAQQMIIPIIQDNMAKTGVGKETLTFVNEKARQAQRKKA